MQGSTEASTSAAPVASAPVPLAPQLQQRLAGNKSSRVAGSKKRKLACEPCRERRVRCDWPDGGGPCNACAQAKLYCPGEPKPKKRLKRGESSPPAPTEIDKRLALYPLGHGGSVHLIDNHIDTALPVIPGLPLRYYRKILYATTEFNSREMEIGAEVICGAFLACAVTYSDDSLFTGSNDFFRPKIAPEGCPYNWETYLPVGTNRRDAAETFSLHARQIFEDSGMRLRPSLEAVYAILAMDQMAVWTAERGRSEREFVQLACETWRTVVRERKEAPKEDHLQPTMGPLAVHLLLLDAETAATLGLGCILTDKNLVDFFAHLLPAASPTPPVGPQSLVDAEQGFAELGQQLVPMSLAVSLAFRSLSTTNSAALANPATPLTYYTTIDAAYNHLSGLEKLISSLPPLLDPNATARRNFDLINLVHLYRRHFLRLDLLIHQRIIESFLSPADPALPQPSLLAYETSSLRVQRCFATVASMAQHATDTACFGSARRLVETLEVCTSWTSLRNADPITAIELIKELGITLETGQTLLQLLCMSGWSLASSSELHKGLLGGLRLMYHVVPPSPHRAPPTVSELERAREEERRLHPERFKNPMHFLSILKEYQKGKEKVEEPAYSIGRWENGQFIEDWSFLDDFMPPQESQKALPGDANSISGPLTASTTTAVSSTGLQSAPTTASSSLDETRKKHLSSTATADSSRLLEAPRRSEEVSSASSVPTLPFIELQPALAPPAAPTRIPATDPKGATANGALQALDPPVAAPAEPSGDPSSAPHKPRTAADPSKKSTGLEDPLTSVAPRLSDPSLDISLALDDIADGAPIELDEETLALLASLPEVDVHHSL